MSRLPHTLRSLTTTCSHKPLLYSFLIFLLLIVHTRHHITPSNHASIQLIHDVSTNFSTAPRLAFDYSRIKEKMPSRNCMGLSSSVHDYLAHPRHALFFRADMKYGYFGVLLHPDDRHYFAFTVPGYGQLQPTRMPQGSESAAFTVSELVRVAYGAIPAPDPEPSLFDTGDPPAVRFYMDDLFGPQLRERSNSLVETIHSPVIEPSPIRPKEPRSRKFSR